MADTSFPRNDCLAALATLRDSMPRGSECVIIAGGTFGGLRLDGRLQHLVQGLPGTRFQPLVRSMCGVSSATRVEPNEGPSGHRSTEC